jgi:hypothetical protein
VRIAVAGDDAASLMLEPANGTHGDQFAKMDQHGVLTLDLGVKGYGGGGLGMDCLE